MASKLPEGGGFNAKPPSIASSKFQQPAKGFSGGGLGDVPSGMAPAPKSALHVVPGKRPKLEVTDETKIELHPDLKLTESAKKDFHYIFSTLAIKAPSLLTGLMFKQTELQKCESRLTSQNIHPLASLIYFSTDLKLSMRQVHTVFTTWMTATFLTNIFGKNPWNTFIEETSEKLRQYHRDNKIEMHLEQFSKEIRINNSDLKKFVSENNWNGFIHLCLGIA